MYYNRNAQGKSLQAHFIMPFLTEKAQSAVATTQTGGYINPTKLESGGSVRFALLDDQPLEFFEVWGESGEGKLNLLDLQILQLKKMLRLKWVMNLLVE